MKITLVRNFIFINIYPDKRIFQIRLVKKSFEHRRTDNNRVLILTQHIANFLFSLLCMQFEIRTRYKLVYDDNSSRTRSSIGQDIEIFTSLKKQNFITSKLSSTHIKQNTRKLIFN